MTNKETAFLSAVNGMLDQILRGNFSNTQALEADTLELQELGDAVLRLKRLLSETNDFVSALSAGRLDVQPPISNYIVSPLKQLHANLRHLTWQAKRVAEGDLEQHVDFMGEFSVAFNSMIASLREKRAAEEKVRYVSVHDALTDLYNRGYFEEEMIRVQIGRMFPVSMIMSDLDGLKTVNDTLGHAAGDRLIKDAASILRKAVRASDVVARMGGDEFAIILPGTDMNDAARILQRIRHFEEEQAADSDGFSPRFSLGLATSGPGQPLAETLRIADERMYVDKFARKQALKAITDGRRGTENG